MGIQLPPEKKSTAPTQLFAHAYCGYGWMDQDATWYRGKTRLRRRCVRWYRCCPLKGAHPQFSVHVYCGQTVGWIKTLLDTDVDLGPGHIVLDGDPAPLESGTATLPPPLFSAHVYCGQVTHLSYC